MGCGKKIKELSYDRGEVGRSLKVVMRCKRSTKRLSDLLKVRQVMQLVPQRIIQAVFQFFFKSFIYWLPSRFDLINRGAGKFCQEKAEAIL